LLLTSDGPSNSLHGGGKLSDSFGSSISSSFTYDPQKPTPAPYWREQFQCGTNEDLREIQSRNDVLVFTSDPILSPINMLGNLQLELFVSTSALDTDFVARLSDVQPNGYAQRLNHGISRLRYREGYESQKFVPPGQIVKIGIDMWATGNQFQKNHRIRLELTSSAFPIWAPNYNTGGNPWEEEEPVIAHQVVYHSQGFPSKLIFDQVSQPKFVDPWPQNRWDEQST
jgi:uncharacterized protein